MSLVAANPFDLLHRPRAALAPPRGLTTENIRNLLNAIPATPSGLRDRAIIPTLTLTGRRRSEVLDLTAKDLTQEDEATFYSYRWKGAEYGKRELPQPALEAIQVTLAALGKDLSTMKPEESLWPSNTDCDRGITSGTFYGNLRPTCG